jgi:hypothetical protein
MYVLTEENIEKFKKLVKEKEKEVEVLDKTATEDIHISELEGLKKAISPELKKKGLL